MPTSQLELALTLTADGRDFVAKVKTSRRAMERLGNAATRTRKFFGDLTREQERLRASTDRTGEGFAGARSQIVRYTAALGAAAALRGIGRTIAEFESLQATLEAVTGDAAVAASEFQRVQEFAARTPFSVAELVRSYTQLSAVGVEASDATLTSIGNLGAVFNDLSGLVGGILSRERETFKRFGIDVAQAGDRLVVTYKGFVREVENSSPGLVSALQDISDKFFPGAMARRAETLGGAISNLGDATDNLIVRFGDGGLRQSLTESTQGLTSLVTALTPAANAVGSLAGALVDLGPIIAGVGIARLNSRFNLLGGAVGGVTNSLARQSRAWRLYRRQAIAAATATGTLTRRTTAYAAASFTAVRAGGRLLSVLGGWPGVILTAGIALTGLVTRTREAEEATDDFGQAVSDRIDLIRRQQAAIAAGHQVALDDPFKTERDSIKVLEATLNRARDEFYEAALQGDRRLEAARLEEERANAYFAPFRINRNESLERESQDRQAARDAATAQALDVFNRAREDLERANAELEKLEAATVTIDSGIESAVKNLLPDSESVTAEFDRLLADIESEYERLANLAAPPEVLQALERQRQGIAEAREAALADDLHRRSREYLALEQAGISQLDLINRQYEEQIQIIETQGQALVDAGARTEAQLQAQREAALVSRNAAIERYQSASAAGQVLAANDDFVGGGESIEALRERQAEELAILAQHHDAVGTAEAEAQRQRLETMERHAAEVAEIENRIAEDSRYAHQQAIDDRRQREEEAHYDRLARLAGFQNEEVEAQAAARSAEIAAANEHVPQVIEPLQRISELRTVLNNEDLRSEAEKNKAVGRLGLEAAQATFGLLAAHSKKAFRLQQASAIALATINAYEGISDALADGGPVLGPILAAVHGAALFAQVSAIRAQSPPQANAFRQGGIIEGAQFFEFERERRVGSSIGVAGEAGAEAIIPLRRTPSGDLGVQAAGVTGNRNVINITAAPTVQVTVAGDADATAIGEEAGAQIVAIIDAYVKEEQRPGGTLAA